MRNWNMWWNAYWFGNSCIQTLPMRNWNYIIAAGRKKKNTIQTLPMRNWNRDKSLPQRGLVKYSDSTYEELKPCRCISDIEPASIFRLYLWGIETSPVLSYLMHWLNIQTLPMRNWNNLISNLLQFCYLIQTLPMRNWNIVVFEPSHSISAIQTLPMRNWNI